MTVEELTHASDWVLHGRVLSTVAEARTVGGRRGIFTTVSVRGDEWLRGEGPPVQQFVVHGGRVGNRASVVHGQARFRAGEEVVVFLYRSPEVVWLTGMSQGKWTVSQARVTSAVDPTALLEHEPGTPSAATTMTLDDLRTRVRNAVQR
jgi:hypothetical protein